MKFFYPVLFLLLLSGCKGKNYSDNFISINGKTQGTTYQVNYFEKKSTLFQGEIDSILRLVDTSFSTYSPASILSAFNRSDTGCRVNEHILKVYWKSLEIYENSHGAFDPTVKPLVDFWGFGSKKMESNDSPDTTKVNSLLKNVGLNKVKLFEKTENKIYTYKSDQLFPPGEYFLLKENSAIQLDFNAIAQGYTVDLVSEFLESRGVENFMVEIGGEVRVKGKNPAGISWEIGIDKPKEEFSAGRPLQAILSLNNLAVATSGNYRKYYVKNGIKYSHTIDTKTGFPVRQNPTMLSVSVIMEKCMDADGYATAFMAGGLNNSLKFISEKKEIGAYIVYDENGNWKTFISEKIKNIINDKM